jgi:hypothetical protein
MLRFLSLLACLVALAASADELTRDIPPPRAVPSPESMVEFVRVHPGCGEISDGCSVCKVRDGITACSTPGIACLPKAWICLP